jgi:hypothetical protein
MAEAKLMLHCGARQVPREAPATVPAATKTWVPVSHETVVPTVEESLRTAGFETRKCEFGLSGGDARLFATLTLGTPLAAGVTLAVGVRKSLDTSFPMGFADGSRVFCCDNLALPAQLLVRRKHTVHGLARFAGATTGAVGDLR